MFFCKEYRGKRPNREIENVIANKRHESRDR